MRRAPLSVLLISLAGFVYGCGGDDTGDGTATGSPTSSGTGGAGGGGNNAQANGCTSFTDASEITMMITSYSPNCVKIKKGGTVTWKGDLATHPLFGGEATANAGTPDSSSPIGQTMTGMEKTVTFPDAGTFGFYCNVHVTVGMRGAVLVE